MLNTPKDTTRHLLLTASILDAVGFSLEDHSALNRVTWLYSERDYLPPQRANRVYDGRGSYNSAMLGMTFAALSEDNPFETEDFADFSGNYAERIIMDVQGSRTNKFLFSDMLVNQTVDNGALMPIAVALACYASLNELPYVESLMLFDQTMTIFHFPNEAKFTAMLLFDLMFELLDSGYVCAETFNGLIERGMVPVRMHSLLRWLSEHTTKPNALLEPMPDDLMSGFTYSQVCLGKVLHCMTKVSTAAPTEHDLDATPKGQLIELCDCGLAKMQDLFFLYGAICMASEQNYPLVNRSFYETSDQRVLVDEALTYF